MLKADSGRKTIAIMVILVLGLCMGPSFAHAEAVVGKITQVSGKGQIRRGASTLDAAAGMPVELHDQLSTGSPGEIILQLADNSVLTVNESSVLSIDETVVGGAGTTKVGLVSGSVRSLVTAAARAAAPKFEVMTPNAIAGVRGTDFICRHRYGPALPGFPADCFEYTDCATTTGEVGVTNNPPKPGVEVTVGPGYMTIVGCGGAPLTPTAGTLAVLGPATGAAAGGIGAAALSSPWSSSLFILGAGGVIAGTMTGIVEGTTGGPSGPLVASPAE
jgi:hypothetical protein